MATSSILEKIKINDSTFVTHYIDAMEASTNMSKSHRDSNVRVVIADAEESKRLSELRHQRRAALHESGHR